MSAGATIDQLAPSFTGQLLRPSDPGYDDAGACTTGSSTSGPAIIARCRGTADVAEAVKLARSLNLEIAVRGGGHNVGGRGTIDDGLMIDLAPMKGIHVDPAKRTARAQGGVLWKEFNRETQLHGLATTGGVVGTTGHCRADARRRPRVADAEIRPGARQPEVRGDGDGRRHGLPCRSRRES